MLSVSEHFFSIQGEGPTMGHPAVFLRLGGCNLLCGGQGTIEDSKLHNGATWRCDTIEVWGKTKKYESEELLQLFEELGYCKALSNGAHLVITGGEPLQQVEGIINFLDAYKNKTNNKLPYIEVETNGTIFPEKTLLEFVKQWNISPKLTNSGMPKKRRYKLDILSQFTKIPHIYFKFVISSEKDLEEISQDFLLPLQLPLEQIFLMPAAETREELEKTMPLVAECARKNGYNLSNRLHIQIWDRKTGI